MTTNARIALNNADAELRRAFRAAADAITKAIPENCMDWLRAEEPIDREYAAEVRALVSLRDQFDLASMGTQIADKVPATAENFAADFAALSRAIVEHL